MKRTTIFLTDELIARLDAQSARTGVKTAELIRRAIDAVTPPISAQPGELKKLIDRAGLLEVFILDARDGHLLVEPGDGGLGPFERTAMIWVEANLVRFKEPVVPQQSTGESVEQSLRLNKDAPTEFDLRTNIKADEPKERSPGDKEDRS